MSEHCRMMQAAQASMQHCQRAAMTACCRDGQEQHESTLPQAPSAGTQAASAAAQTAWLPLAASVSLLRTGCAWYARPPTHGYSSQSLRLLHSVILV